MLEFLNHIDHTLFLFLNGINNPFFDSVMYRLTKTLVWIPLYLFFLYLIIRQYNWKTIIILVLAALMILVSDQLSNLVKDSVQRLRPSHQPGLYVHIVEAYKGGIYGFYSAHASNTFSVAVFLILLLGRKWYVILPALLWTLFVSYTRIYLGVHYPGDIFAGWIAGGIIGFLLWKGAAITMEAIRKKTYV